MIVLYHKTNKYEKVIFNCRRVPILSSCVSTKLAEYGEDGICRPTVDGFQELHDLEYKSPNETYFWNYKQCKWTTKSEHEQLVNDAFKNVKLPLDN